MKPGDLVRITRAAIGVPRDTVGLILDTVEPRSEELYDLEFHVIQLCNSKSRVIRRLERDLEVINAGR